MHKMRHSKGQSMMKQLKEVMMHCLNCKALLPQYVPTLNLGNAQPQKMLVKHCPNCGAHTVRVVNKQKAKTQSTKQPTHSPAFPKNELVTSNNHADEVKQ
jgi:Zn finger protein HypA/HybF involved in hydrogenase expression